MQETLFKRGRQERGERQGRKICVRKREMGGGRLEKFVEGKEREGKEESISRETVIIIRTIL